MQSISITPRSAEPTVSMTQNAAGKVAELLEREGEEGLALIENNADTVLAPWGTSLCAIRTLTGSVSSKNPPPKAHRIKETIPSVIRNPSSRGTNRTLERQMMALPPSRSVQTPPRKPATPPTNRNRART